jgi:hypothetical protein
MGKGGMHIPEAETGGIVSGPDSGYLAKLHGNEMVVPINNNYTQGQPSAMDGKVRPKPFSSSRSTKGVKTSGLPSFERGTPGSSVGGRFGFGITNMRGIASGGSTQSSAMAQPLVDAMSLPMMAAGGSILATVSKLMTSMGSEGASIAPEIERIARPIADVFGLPPSIVKKTKQGMGSKTKTGLFDEEDGGESKKNIFNKLMDGFGALMEKLKDGVNNNPPPPPGPTGTGSDSAGENLAAFISTLEATGEQNQADVMQVMVNRAKGDSDKLFDEVTGKAQFTPASSAIYGATGHDPAADAAYGHIAPLLGNTPEERKAKLREIAAGSNGLNNLAELFKTKNSGEAAKVLADFKTGGPLSTKSKADVGGGLYFKGRSQNPSGVFLDRGDAGANKFHGSRSGTAYSLAQSAPVPPPNTSPTGQLGQAITNNYGMKVNEERTFNHPQYGELKARKTTKGFDFYRGGTILNVSPANPQGKSIVDYFTSTNGGRLTSTKGDQASISPPPGSDRNAQTQTIAQKIDDTGNANIIAMMMPPGQQKQTASTSLPSSAESTAASPGFNALTQSGLYNPLYG